MAGITVQNVSFSYGAKKALIDLTLQARPGGVTALLGPNGAGKSTLFALLTGLFHTREGQIEVNGHDLSRHPRKALADMGVVFQQPTLDADLTVIQNLRYFAALRGLRGKSVQQRIDRALDQLDMRARAGEKVRALNGGHRRRMEMARALLHDPSVLLLDEPTVGLDAMTRRAITRHIHDLAAERGMAVLWATHLVDEILPDDDLVLLDNGRILARGLAGEVAHGQPLDALLAARIAAGVAA